MNTEYFSFLEHESDADLHQSMQGIFSAHQLFSQYKIIFAQGFMPPLFIVPTSFSNISYEYSRLTFSSKRSKKTPVKKPAIPNETKQDDIFLPEVDSILSLFANSYRAVQFSIKIFKYLTNSSNHIQLLIADNPYSEEALKYYKADPLNITQLETLLTNEETKYRSKLAQITYISKTKQPNGTEIQTSLNLTQKNSDGFINLVKADVDKDWLNKYFLQNRALIIQNARFTEKEYSEEELVDLPQIKSMFDVIVYAEGTGNDYGKIALGVVKKSPYYPELIGQKDVTIQNFSRHPEISVDYGSDWTTAAGRYQFLYKTWKDIGGDKYDFSPRSQDIIAVKLMMRRKMIEPLLNGDIRLAIYRGSPEWASFPMENGKSRHKQPVKNISDLERIYNESVKKY